MAEEVTYICGECGHAIEAWSDCNPYYIDKNGDKQYAYGRIQERFSATLSD